MTPSPAAEVCPTPSCGHERRFFNMTNTGRCEYRPSGNLSGIMCGHRCVFPPAPEQKPCDHCGGTGKVPFLPTLTVECKYCNGTGVAAPAAPAPALANLKGELLTHGRTCACPNKKVCEDREEWLRAEIARAAPAAEPASPPERRCKICGYALIKTTTQETGWQQWVCPNVGKNNSLGHDIEPIGYLLPIETKVERGRETNLATALNVFLRCSDYLKDKLADNPDASCGCGSCPLCAYRYFESKCASRPAPEQARLAAEEIARRWLAHDLPMKAQIQSLSLLQLEILALDVIERRLNCNERAAAPPPEQARELIDREATAAMFHELFNCYTASKCNAEGLGDREEFLRLKGMAEAFQSAEQRIRELPDYPAAPQGDFRAGVVPDTEVRQRLIERFPNVPYDPDIMEMPVCQECNGAIDDHKADCIVPDIYALLNSDLYRAGVAACVQKVKAARDEWNSLIANDEDRWHKGGHCAAEELVTALESLTDSVAADRQGETIQECIDRGFVLCPACNIQRQVDKQGNVLACPCGALPWNLFITLHPTADKEGEQ